MERKRTPLTGFFRRAVTRTQLKGLLALADGNIDEGLTMLQQAAETEAAMPFEFGPPGSPMPGHELWAQALIGKGQLDQAREVLAVAESRTPGRITLTRARTSLDAGQ
jgi:hypothetical protein